MPKYRSIRILTYGDSVEEAVSVGVHAIEELKFEWRRGNETFSELTDHLQRVVFRQFLDPLARSHAFYEGMPSTEKPHYPLEELQASFFLQHVQPYWEEFHALLRDSARFELLSMSRTIEAIDFAIQRLIRDLDTYIRIDIDE